MSKREPPDHFFTSMRRNGPRRSVFTHSKVLFVVYHICITKKQVNYYCKSSLAKYIRIDARMLNDPSFVPRAICSTLNKCQSSVNIAITVEIKGTKAEPL